MTAPPTRLRAILDFQPGSERGLLGIWVVAPAAMGDVVAFDTGAAAPAGVARWRMSLPADSDAAAAQLAQAEDSLRRSREQLDVSSRRLPAFIRSLDARPSVDFAFDVGTDRGRLGKPEANLAALLQAAQRGRVDSGPLVFDAGGLPQAGLEQAAQAFQGFLNGLWQSMASLAWVETMAGSMRYAWSIVDWSGSTRNLWQDGLSVGQADLHRRALALALASREALIRHLALTARGAALLAKAAAMPLGPILALPAAWKFIEDVRREAQARDMRA